MFQGMAVVSLDAKGRLPVPARYRKELADSYASRLVLTIDRDKCLLLYPEAEWEKIRAKLTALPALNRKVRELQRLLIGNATDSEMDSQGRILVPPKLQAIASLDKRVAVVGMGSRVELWDEDTWDRNIATSLEDPDLQDLRDEVGISDLVL